MKQAIESADVRTLRKLIQEINSDTKNSLSKWLKAGELLTRIKSNTKYGDWNDVLLAVQVSFNTASRYMAFWARRSTINLSEVQAPEDALKLLHNGSAKISTAEIATTQNEPLTHEKTSNAETNSGAKSSPSKQRSVRSNGTDVTATETDSKASEIRLDKVGRPIPEGILGLWNHAYETGTRLRSAISAIKCELEKGIGHDKVFAELINSVISDAEALHYSLAQIIPFAVCPTCQGKLVERCTTCRHRGFISKFYWDGPAIGKDIRTLIQKQADKYASTTLSA